MNMLRICLVLAFAGGLFGRVRAEGDLIGFWDFKGTAGESVSTLQNSLGDVKYTGTADKSHTTSGRLPTYAAEPFPYRVLTSEKGGGLCTDLRAIDFFYATRADHQGGYIDIAGLADKLSGLSAFTVEYFIKLDEDFKYAETGVSKYNWTSKTALYLQSQDHGFKLIAPSTADQTSGAAKGFGCETYDTSAKGGLSGLSKQQNIAANDGNWNHIAVTYQETDAANKTGTLTYYVNYVKIGDFAYKNTAGTGLKFRLGSGFKNLKDGSDKTATESMHGSIAALRVSSATLGNADLMRLDKAPDVPASGTVGFWPFKDGVAGSEATSLANGVAGSTVQGKGAITWDGSQQKGAKPTFSSDAPGRYVYSDVSCGTLLAENPQSLYFHPGTSTDGGSKLELPWVATLLSRQSEYTVEFFFKPENSDAYRTLVAWHNGEKTGMKLNLTDTPHQTMYMETLTNTTSSTLMNWYGSRSFKAGTKLSADWHHMAFVYSDNQLKMYFDYVDRGSVPFTNTWLNIERDLTFGAAAFSFKAIQEAYKGYIACPRVTTRALSNADFLVVTDAAVKPNTVFAINFEEGADLTAGTEIPDGAAKVYPSASRMTTVKKYGLSKVAVPRFDRTSKARNVLWGTQRVADLMWPNTTCGWFQGYNSATDLSETRVYAGTELAVLGTDGVVRNPSSWTMEAFVKVEYSPKPADPNGWNDYSSSHGALLFGKYGNANPHSNPKTWPQYCWMLSRKPNGHLEVSWTETLTEGDYPTAEGISASCYKRAETSVDYLGDKKWHHVALSYDKSTSTFKLYVDYKLVMTKEVGETGLYDGPYGYYFSRIEATSGFEGWMDEIRYSSVALQPEQFEHFDVMSLLLMFR